MLVHQCDSCGTIAKKWTNIGRPAGWGIVTVELPATLEPGSAFTREYSLCPECLKTPITFGELKLHPTAGVRVPASDRDLEAQIVSVFALPYDRVNWTGAPEEVARQCIAELRARGVIIKMAD